MSLNIKQSGNRFQTKSQQNIAVDVHQMHFIIALNSDYNKKRFNNYSHEIESLAKQVSIVAQFENRCYV